MWEEFENEVPNFYAMSICAGAFFDMYIGEFPVSKQAKEEIGKNVASIIRRCN